MISDRKPTARAGIGEPPGGTRRVGVVLRPRTDARNAEELEELVLEAVRFAVRNASMSRGTVVVIMTGAGPGSRERDGQPDKMPESAAATMRPGPNASQLARHE